MIKLIAIIKRRADITHEEFRAYYEAHHAPLIKSILGEDLVGYTRNYVNSDNPTTVGVSPQFDCVSEFLYADQAGMERVFAKITAPENDARVRADELNFMDVPALQIAFVDPVSGAAPYTGPVEAR